METLKEIIAILAVVLVIVGFVWYTARNKKWKLEDLLDLPGEEVKFEEDGVPVKQIGRPSPVVFSKCKIRITNKRIIIAQPVLGKSDNYVLRYVVITDSTVFPNKKYQGYTEFSINSNDIQFSASEIQIPIKGIKLLDGQSIVISGGDIEKIKNLI